MHAIDDTASGHATTAVQDLDGTECLFLLRWATVGRVVVPDVDRTPVVVPVTFTMDRDTIIFHFDPGPLLDRLLHEAVTFEADGSDPFHHLGWVVQVDGLALEIDEDPGHEPPTEPWSPAGGQVTVRLTPTTINGHRFEIIHPDHRPGRHLVIPPATLRGDRLTAMPASACDREGPKALAANRSLHPAVGTGSRTRG
jgi:Pyridoxamine 5'-phosphate oxidase